MALDRLFREVIDPALKEYRKGKSYLDEVEQQARDNIHEIYYTNTWCKGILDNNISQYIYGKPFKGNRNIAGAASGGFSAGLADPSNLKDVQKNRGKDAQGFATLGVEPEYKNGTSKTDRDKIRKILLAEIDRQLKKHNTPTKWKWAIGQKLPVGKTMAGGKRLSAADQKLRQNIGYVTLSRNKHKGGGTLLTMVGGKGKKTITPFGRGVNLKTGRSTKQDKLGQAQHAFLSFIMKAAVKKARKNKEIKKIMASDADVKLMFNVKSKDGVSKKYKGAQKLHAGAGSRRGAPGSGHVLPKTVQDPGFGDESDTTARMMSFLKAMEDGVGQPGDLDMGPKGSAMRTVSKQINDAFNAGYCIEGVQRINLFGTSKGGGGRRKRYLSKDIVATKDITVKIALGTKDQNALARKADKEGSSYGGLDGFFRELEKTLKSHFKDADELASLSIRELARRGVFANVARNMKTASGMPDMRFKINKQIFAEAQQKFKAEKKLGGSKLQRKSTKIVRQTDERAPRINTSVAGGTIGANLMRNRVGNNPLALEALLEKALPKVVASKMTSPALVYRTGRFANSAEVTDVMVGPRGGMHIDYTYMKDPYETFEPGNRQGSTFRDPRKIIGSSIRQIAQSIVGDKFIRIRRT